MHSCHCHSLLLMALVFPNCPFQTGSVVCVCVCGAYYVSLACSLLDNLITTFSDTLTYRSKTALWNAADFWQSGGLWDVCVGGDFLSFFFCFCFSFLVLRVIIYISSVTEKNGRKRVRREGTDWICGKHEIGRLRVQTSQLMDWSVLSHGGRCSFDNIT